MLGFAADHLSVEWYPAGAFIIEQGEPAAALYCLLAGSVDIVVEDEHGARHYKDSAGAGSFVGEDGLATGRLRNAHVVAREDVTCLVLTPRPADRSAPRGVVSAPSTRSCVADASATGPDPDYFSVDVSASLGRKVAALAAHRSQYAMEPELLPAAVLGPLLGVEHFVAVPVGAAATATRSATAPHHVLRPGSRRPQAAVRSVPWSSYRTGAASCAIRPERGAAAG